MWAYGECIYMCATSTMFMPYIHAQNFPAGHSASASAALSGALGN